MLRGRVSVKKRSVTATATVTLTLARWKFKVEPRFPGAATLYELQGEFRSSKSGDTVSEMKTKSEKKCLISG